MSPPKPFTMQIFGDSTVDEFLSFLKDTDQGRDVSTLDDFAKLQDHVQIQLLNSFMTRGCPQRTIQNDDWRKVLENLLQIQPADQSDEKYSLREPSSWSVVEIPATVRGIDSHGSYVSEYPLNHVHGQKHGIAAEYVTMGVVVARNLKGYPSSMVLINVFQDWSGFSHCFCSVELERVSDDEYTFVSGTFHPGQGGLIHEKEIEFLGFLESYFKDMSGSSPDEELLPGRWVERRESTRVYRPGVNEGTGRATLMDVYSGDTYQWDYVVNTVCA